MFDLSKTEPVEYLEDRGGVIMGVGMGEYKI